VNGRWNFVRRPAISACRWRHLHQEREQNRKPNLPAPKMHPEIMASLLKSGHSILSDVEVCDAEAFEARNRTSNRPEYKSQLFSERT
jgi:hypothetical protein